MYLISRSCVTIFAGDGQGWRHYGSSVFLWMWYLANAFRGFYSKVAQMSTLTQGWPDSILEVKSQRSQQPPVSWADISRTPWGIFIKSGTNPHLDSTMSWGQRSLEPHILWTRKLKNSAREFRYIWHKYLYALIHWLIRLEVQGQRSLQPQCHCNLKNALRGFLQIWYTGPLGL